MIDRDNAAELVRRVEELFPAADAALVRRCVEFALEHQAKQRPDGRPIERAVVLAAIGGWANQIAARYGAPVWLVGSALDHEDLRDVRDVDVRVVLPDAAFEARFDVAVEAWARETWSTWSIGSRRWGAEMGKLSRGWMAQFHRLGVGLDFQVHPIFVARAFWEKPRRRLDTLDLAGPIDLLANP